jgi:hypothetical protein
MLSGGLSNFQTDLIIASIRNAINHPLIGVPVLRYRAEFAADRNYDRHGNPHYLSPDATQDATGIIYPEPPESIRGVFCPNSITAIQESAGQRIEVDANLFLVGDPGPVYQLSQNRPKRQDKFIISGATYYAATPAYPCSSGEVIGAYRISLARQRQEVENARLL